jgi:hypothetical protein
VQVMISPTTVKNAEFILNKHVAIAGKMFNLRTCWKEAEFGKVHEYFGQLQSQLLCARSAIVCTWRKSRR